MSVLTAYRRPVSRRSGVGLGRRGVILDNCVLYAPLWHRALATSPFSSRDPNEHIFAVTGTVWGAYGRYFNGSGDYINKELTPGLRPAAITIGAWAKKYTAGGGSIVAMLPRGAGGGRGYKLDLVANARTVKGTGVAWVLTTGAIAISTGVWYFVAGTFDTTNGGVIYLNGVSDGTSSDLTAINWTDLGAGNYPNPAQIYLAADKSNALGAGATVPSSFFNLDIGDVFIFSLSLTATEVMGLYLATEWRYRA